VQILPREKWIPFAHTLIYHGRAVCDARLPRCSECVVRDLCPSALPAGARPRRTVRA
jgi:endonuclease III